MYALIGYYWPPQREKGIFDKLFSRPGTLYVYLSPQLYKPDFPSPIHKIPACAINLGNMPEPARKTLEDAIIDGLRGIISDGVRVGNLLIPSSQIEIKVEKVEED